ncbi:MAG: GTP 3',8-cyclase 1 [Gammaproteobacteria bacterium]|nr:MAG: GTP 3',8-cyclase 1 [Gammaproteobacteria bacterium]
MHRVLHDRFARPISYLRLSVTDRCDLRCHYCLPKGFRGFYEPAHWLDFDELTRLAGLFAAHGVRHVRLTGGEPLLRRNLPELVARLAALPGVERVSLSTNAVRLAKWAAALKAAGLRRLNISLDSLRPERYAAITGGGRLDKVLDGIEAARAAGFRSVRINMVVMRGINDDEVEDLLEFCLARGLLLRYIETMPVGDTGRLAVRHHLPLDHVRARLARRYTLLPVLPAGAARTAGPARYLRIAERGGARVGFITPLSDHFCADCNRVRLTADGTLYPCLGDEHSVPLGRLLRAGADDAALLEAVARALAAKPEGHRFNQNPERVIRFMSLTGG